MVSVHLLLRQVPSLYAHVKKVSHLNEACWLDVTCLRHVVCYYNNYFVFIHAHLRLCFTLLRRYSLRLTAFNGIGAGLCYTRFSIGLPRTQKLTSSICLSIWIMLLCIMFWWEVARAVTLLYSNSVWQLLPLLLLELLHPWPLCVL